MRWVPFTHSLCFCASPLFFFNATPSTEIYTLSLHDALPIFIGVSPKGFKGTLTFGSAEQIWIPTSMYPQALRSEEHTSELQSRFDLVCRLLLEKKKHVG